MPSSTRSADGAIAESHDDSATRSASQAHDQRVKRLEHEILNCLGIVHLGTHILATAREDNDKVAEWAGIMEHNRKQAVELVNELAALARHHPDDHQTISLAQSGDGDQEF
ncbi:MAG: hypothetical protein ABI780_11810 [Ardenticatenales bacterium]